MKFKDTTGQEWDCSLVYSTIMRVRSITGVDLLDVEKFGQAFADPLKVIDVAWAIVKPAAEKIGLTEPQFVDRFTGKVADDAADAIIAGLVDFFRDSPRGELLKKLIAAGKTASENAMKKVDQRLAKLTEQSGNAPGSSESTPESSHSASS